MIGFLFACKEEQKPTPDYTILKGKITNAEKDKKLRLYNPENSENTLIEVKEDGSFRDTLKLKEPTYYNVTYNGIFQLYLSNGMDLNVNFDAKEPGKSLDFEGKGSEANNYVCYKSGKMQELLGKDYRVFLSLEDEKYNNEKQTFTDKLNTHLKKNEDKLDSAFIASEKKKTDQMWASLDTQHKEQLEINKKIGKGKMSPQFEDYKNYEGGTSSLKDFKGSYVYIDVWATWCVPCIVEIPYMKKIEEQYKDKDIKFIGLSLDNPKQEDKWRKMIEDKELAEESIQLLTDNELKSQFIQDYYISAIPRFILLDPEGRIINYDAPRPSYPELKDIFDSLEM